MQAITISHHCTCVTYILHGSPPVNIAQLYTECMNFFQIQLLVMEFPFANIFFSSKDESSIGEVEHNLHKPKANLAISNTAIYFY